MSRFARAVPARRHPSTVRRSLLFVALAVTSCVALDAAHGAVRRPTTDTQPFRKIHLYDDRSGAYNQSDHIAIMSYPPALNDTSLLAVRTSGDTAGVFRSMPYDATNLRVTTSGDSAFVRYVVDPPRYANWVDVLLMGTNIFDGSGAFADNGKTLARVLVTFEDGSQYLETFLVGSRLRHWQSGTNCSSPYFINPGSSPFTGTLYSESGRYYDDHRVVLPGHMRGKKVAWVQVNAYRIAHFCSEASITIYGGIRVCGLSVGSNFLIENRAGGGVVKQSQGDAAWGNLPYGGYDHGGTIVGSYYNIRRKGCWMTSVSMAHNFYGVASTPATLNTYLQQNQGFQREQLATLVATTKTVVDSSVVFVNVGGDPPAIGETFLVEHGTYGNPVATIEVTSDPDSVGKRKGKVKTLHGSPDTLAVGDGGYIFRYPIHAIAARDFSLGAWQLEGVPSSPTTASTVEDALADSIPVMIHGRLTAGGTARHWVLADGLVPHYVASGNAHRGTYSIKDPGYPATNLALGPHDNKMSDARICRRVASYPAPESWDRGLAGTADGVLMLQASGPVHLEVTGPAGSITYDAAEDDYVTSNPDVFVSRGWVYEDLDDDAFESAPVDIIEIPGAAAGDYTVEVTGDAGGAFALQVGALDAGGTPSAAVQSGTTSGGGTHQYQVTLSSTPGTPVTVTEVPTGVGDRPAPRSGLSLAISPNPTRGRAVMTYTLDAAASVDLAVFDLQGRRVATIERGSRPAGTHAAAWDGAGPSGVRAEAGVYFVRLSTGAGTVIRRLALVAP